MHKKFFPQNFVVKGVSYKQMIMVYEIYVDVEGFENYSKWI